MPSLRKKTLVPWEQVADLNSSEKVLQMSTIKLKTTRAFSHLHTRLQKKKREILDPGDIIPSNPSLSCLGVLNPAILSHQGRTYLLFRVDEYASQQNEGTIGEDRTLSVPTLSADFKSVRISAVSVPSGYDFRKQPILPTQARRAPTR